MDRAEQLKIFARCLGDPIYGIETFLKTFDLTQEGMVPFKLFYKQKEVIKSYEEFNRNLVTKPRQAGVSTTTAAYIAVKSAFASLTATVFGLAAVLALRPVPPTSTVVALVAFPLNVTA